METILKRKINMTVLTPEGELDVIAVEEGVGLSVVFSNRMSIFANGDGFELTFYQLDGTSLDFEKRTIDARVVSQVFVPPSSMENMMSSLDEIRLAMFRPPEGPRE